MEGQQFESFSVILQNNLIMVKLAILASGNGTNAQRISEYFAGNEHVSVECIIYNKRNAYVA